MLLFASLYGLAICFGLIISGGEGYRMGRKLAGCLVDTDSEREVEVEMNLEFASSCSWIRYFINAADGC